MKMYQAILLTMLMTFILRVSGGSGDVFKDNKKHIIQNSISVIDNYIFSLASSKPISSSSTAKNGAIKKAQVKAKYNIVDYLIKENINISEITKSLFLRYAILNAIRHHYLRNRVIDFSGSETLFKEFSDGKGKSIISIPVSKDLLSIGDWSKLKPKILQSAFNGDLAYDPFLITELNSLNNKDQSLLYLNNYLIKNYNVEDFLIVYNKGKMNSIPHGFLNGNLLSRPEFRKLKLFEKLKYIQIFKHHSEYYYLIAKDLETKECYNSSELFYFLGSICPMPGVFRRKCKNSLMNDSLLVHFKKNYSTNIQAHPDFDETNDLYRAKGNGEIYNKIVQTKGFFPLIESAKKNEHYRIGETYFYSNPPMIEQALSAFKNALEQNITASTCNMIARSLYLSGENETALYFYNQAYQISNYHPYALANLSITLNRIGNRKLSIFYAKKAIQNPGISDWSKNELKNAGLL